LNPRPINRKSNALPLSHHATYWPYRPTGEVLPSLLQCLQAGIDTNRSSDGKPSIELADVAVRTTVRVLKLSKRLRSVSKMSQEHTQLFVQMQTYRRTSHSVHTARRYALWCLSVCPSVCLCVCPSVTSRCSIIRSRKQHHTIAYMDSRFWCQKSLGISMRLLSTGAPNADGVGYNRRF